MKKMTLLIFLAFSTMVLLFSCNDSKEQIKSKNNNKRKAANKMFQDQDSIKRSTSQMKK